MSDFNFEYPQEAHLREMDNDDFDFTAGGWIDVFRGVRETVVPIPLGSHGYLISLRDDSCIYMDDPRFDGIDSPDAKGEFDFHEDCLYTGDKDERTRVAETEFNAVGIATTDTYYVRAVERRVELQEVTERLIREYQLLREHGMNPNQAAIDNLYQIMLGFDPNE